MAGALMNRVNEQPPIALGLSQSEFFCVLVCVTVASAVTLCIIFSFIWTWMGGLMMTPPATYVLTKVAGKRFAKAKVGKPANYYPLLIKLQLDKFMDRVLGTHGVFKHGAWSVVRRNRFEGGQ